MVRARERTRGSLLPTITRSQRENSCLDSAICGDCNIAPCQMGNGRNLTDVPHSYACLDLAISANAQYLEWDGRSLSLITAWKLRGKQGAKLIGGVSLARTSDSVFNLRMIVFSGLVLIIIVDSPVVRSAFELVHPYPKGTKVTAGRCDLLNANWPLGTTMREGLPKTTRSEKRLPSKLRV